MKLSERIREIDGSNTPLLYEEEIKKVMTWIADEVSQLEAKAERLLNKAYSYELDSDGNRISWRALEADKDMIRMELEASLGKCSVDGQEPALLVDAKEKGTYWLCADCMFEKIQDKMKLEAENEKWRAIGNELKKAREERAIARTRIIYEMLDALEAGGDSVAG